MSKPLRNIALSLAIASASAGGVHAQEQDNKEPIIPQPTTEAPIIVQSFPPPSMADFEKLGEEFKTYKEQEEKRNQGLREDLKGEFRTYSTLAVAIYVGVTIPLTLTLLNFLSGSIRRENQKINDRNQRIESKRNKDQRLRMGTEILALEAYNNLHRFRVIKPKEFPKEYEAHGDLDLACSQARDSMEMAEKLRETFNERTRYLEEATARERKEMEQYLDSDRTLIAFTQNIYLYYLAARNHQNDRDDIVQYLEKFENICKTFKSSNAVGYKNTSFVNYESTRLWVLLHLGRVKNLGQAGDKLKDLLQQATSEKWVRETVQDFLNYNERFPDKKIFVPEVEDILPKRTI